MAEIDRLEIQIEAQASNASKQLDILVSKMGKLHTSLAGAGLGKNTPLTSLNKNLNQYSTSANVATKSTKSLASAIGKFYASAFLAIRGVKALGRAIESSMDFLETVNYFEVAMRQIGDTASAGWEEAGYNSAESYAESFSARAKQLTEKMTGFAIDTEGNASITGKKSLGLDPNQVLQNQAVFAQISSSIGVAEESALNFSKALTMLGADWASLRNITFNQSWEKFASALAGQSRAVRSLGIDITMATLQEVAYANGVKMAVQEMNQATKAQLRLLAILNQSEVAFGDLANTISSPSNQLRLLQQNFANLARTIGNLFLPVVSKILPVINGIVIALQRLFSWIGGLLGIKFDTINSSMGGMSDSMSDLVGGTDDYEDSLEDANQAAKKLKSTVLGIDELNINAPDESAGGGANKPSVGGGMPELDTAIADALAEYERIWKEAFDRMENKAQEFADAIEQWFKKAWKAIEPFRESLKKLWNEGLSKLANFTWTALKDFYNEFLVPIGLWAFGTEGQGLTRLVDIINNSLMKINWESLNKSLKEFWIAIEPYAERFGEGLIDFFEDVSNFAVDVINKFPGLLDKITEILNNGDPKKARDWGYAFGQLALGIMAFKLAFKGFVAVEAGIAVFKRIQDVAKWFGGTKVGIMIAKLPSLSSVIIGFSNALSYIGMVSPAMLPALFDKLALEFPKLANAFAWFTEPKGILKIINDWLFDIVDGIANAVKEIPSALGSIFQKTIESFTKAGIAFDIGNWVEVGANIVEGILNGFGEAISFIFAPITYLFNQIWKAICNVFGIHSPATSMYPIGENILLGIVEGFSSMFGEFTSAVQSWWDTSVAPWFTVEQWSLLWENIKTAFLTKWEELVEWWNTSAIFLWWEESVAPWFSIETWSTLLSNIQLAFSEIWTKLVKWWNESAIGKWWKENVSPYFTLKFWSDGMAGIIDAFKQVFKNAANGAIEIFNSLINWINEKMHFEWDAITILGQEIVPAGSAQLFTIPPIPKFATGAVVTRPTFSMIGENGPEAIVPLKNNTEWMNGVSAGILENMGNSRSDDLIREEIELLREQNRLLMAIADKEMVAVMDSRETLSALRQQASREGMVFST